MFDPRLQAVIIKIVDVSYGGENGFNQAIELSADSLQNVKFIAEKKLISSFFDEIAVDSGKFVYGIKETLECLDINAVKILIVWEELQVNRFVLRNNQTGVETQLYLNPEQEKDQALFHDKETGVELETVVQEPLIEWFANNYKSWGCDLEFITDKSQEGSQFCKGFGGVGGILRFKPELGPPPSMDENHWVDDDNFDDL